MRSTSRTSRPRSTRPAGATSTDRRPPTDGPEVLLPRCTFPAPGTAVVAAFSGGPDSTALLALASAAGCDVHAVHVDHGLRPSSADEADHAVSLAAALGVPCEIRRVVVDHGPNLEARCRDARRAVLPPDHLTGHTADDQAETLLINLLRGTGIDGLAAMAPGPQRPLLALRRSETRALCDALGLVPVVDPTNDDPRYVRNRVRNELIPLLDDIAQRDVAALLARTARVVRDDLELLDRLADGVDTTDARALARLDPPLARRVLRRWLTTGGYAPDLATVTRAYAVVIGASTACDLGRGRRLERTSGRLRIVE